MSHIATQILDLIKAHPEWAAALIACTAFGESLLFVSLLLGLVGLSQLDQFRLQPRGCLLGGFFNLGQFGELLADS